MDELEKLIPIIQSVENVDTLFALEDAVMLAQIEFAMKTQRKLKEL